MNLIEHYVKTIHEVRDVTNDFKKRTGYTPKEALYEVTMDVNCMGNTEKKTKQFFATEWNTVKERGYYLA